MTNPIDAIGSREPARPHHEGLFQQLQTLAKDRQQLHRKVQDWEKAYHSLRDIEQSLIKAYGSLQKDNISN